MKNGKWKLNDVILIAILGILFAAIYLVVANLGLALSVALTPLGLSTFAYELIYGIWFMAATIAAYIIRKPGAALVAEVLAAVIEMFMGNIGGGVVVITGIIQGAGAELGFTVFKYKRYDFLSMTCSAALAAIAIFIFELFYAQNYLLSPLLLLAKLAVRLISATVFSSIIPVKVCNALSKAGVLKNFSERR